MPPVRVFDLDSFTLGYVNYVLDLNNGNKNETARQLGISRSTLYCILENGQNPCISRL
jgi:DNA-binding NtrC family response regulator